MGRGIRLAAGWKVRRSNPGGEDEISRTRSDRPWDPPSVLYDGYRVSVPGVKWPERGFENTPQSGAEVTERVGIQL
jgi:hypothetical protein